METIKFVIKLISNTINVLLGFICLVLFIFGTVFLLFGIVVLLSSLGDDPASSIDDGVIMLIISIPFLYIGIRYYRENVRGINGVRKGPL